MKFVRHVSFYFLICVNGGNGIDAGLLLDGHPYKGCSGGMAGELGHMVIEPKSYYSDADQ